MGLGKIARGGGKLLSALQVGVLLWDLGGAIVARVRGRSGKPAADGADKVDQPKTDPGDGADPDHNQLQH